jgi:hypothetical protein
METISFNKEHFLVYNTFQYRPKRIAQDASLSDFLKWRAFIDYLNTTYHTQITGGVDLYSYYGVIDGCVETLCNEDPTVEGNIVWTIDEVVSALSLNVQSELDFAIIGSEREVMLISHTTLIERQESMYYGQRISNDRVIAVDEAYGGGFAATNEVNRDLEGRVLIQTTASYYGRVWSSYNDCYIDPHDEYTYQGFADYSGNRVYFSANEPDLIETIDTHDFYADAHYAEEYGCRYIDGDWYRYYDSVQSYNAGYHSQERNVKCNLWDTPFRVGFEVEKEDGEAGKVQYYDIHDEVGWCKENDSSLDSDTGYELISPIYDLYGSDLENDIERSKDLKMLINASHSKRCGGHINLSSLEYTPGQLFEGLSGFFPLLYAIYNNRLEQHYCQAKKKHEYYGSDKYCAIYIKNHLIEFRIFPAVTSVKNLLWRRDLIRIMCNNINADEITVLKMMTNQASPLYRHLRKIFTQEQIIDKVYKFIELADEFGNKKIKAPEERISRMKTNKDKLVNATGTTDEMAA